MVIVVGINYAFAWTGPTTTAPGGNTKPPLTISSDAQYKEGGLAIGKTSGPTGALTLDVNGSTATRGLLVNGLNSIYGSQEIHPINNPLVYDQTSLDGLILRVFNAGAGASSVFDVDTRSATAGIITKNVSATTIFASDNSSFDKKVSVGHSGTPISSTDPTFKVNGTAYFSNDTEMYGNARVGSKLSIGYGYLPSSTDPALKLYGTTNIGQGGGYCLKKLVNFTSVNIPGGGGGQVIMTVCPAGTYMAGFNPGAVQDNNDSVPMILCQSFNTSITYSGGWCPN